jgi:hypothetical protein
MKILCPVDGSDFSRLLIQGVGTVFRSRIKEIVLMHVLPAGHMGKQRIPKDGKSDSWPSLSEKMTQASNKL